VTDTVDGLSARCWSIEEWLRAQDKWNELLGRSTADPLFLSWDWLTLWWQLFGTTRAYSPEIVAFYRGEQLVGVAPFYRTRLFRGRFVPARSVQFMGLAWRDPEPLISEYLDVIAIRGEEEAVRNACTDRLLDDGDWTEFVIGFSETSEAWARGLTTSARTDHYVRQTDRVVSYQADLSEGFAVYLKRLGQNSRRSVWGLRRRLTSNGAVRLEHVDAASIDSAFVDMNRLHQLRWQMPAFAGSRLMFHRTLAKRLAERGELAMTRLWSGDRVISVLYDVRRGERQYNLKLAFDPAFQTHASLGLLHLGYGLEAAASGGAKVYDFLAGMGQKTDFKRHLSQRTRELYSVQMLRGYVLPKLYSWHDRKAAAKRAAAG
jgi:CelD/BcsL family acetyltransferase involved in cellulose biosynthesis